MQHSLCNIQNVKRLFDQSEAEKLGRSMTTVNDGLAFKGSHVVVPRSMQKEIKEGLHTAHIGVESTLRRA